MTKPSATSKTVVETPPTAQKLEVDTKKQGAREVKYRESVRDREKRRELKGQSCFRC